MREFVNHNVCIYKQDSIVGCGNKGHTTPLCLLTGYRVRGVEPRDTEIDRILLLDNILAVFEIVFYFFKGGY